MALALFAGGISNTQQLGLFSNFTHPNYDISAQRSGGSFDFQMELQSQIETISYAAPAPEPPPPIFIPAGGPVQVQVTHYGESFNGLVLGCGTGYYTSDNPTIIAVGPARSAEWPCGTPLQVCGPVGCIDAFRHDSCPGCSPYVIDLSEAGIALVCGEGASVCRATVTRMVETTSP